MAHEMGRQRIDALEWATVPEVGDGTAETQRQFALWYQSENQRWTESAQRRLRSFPHLVEDAVQRGAVKGYRQLHKPESAVTALWSSSQIGDDQALDQLRGYMYRTIERAALDLLAKAKTGGLTNLGKSDPKRAVGDPEPGSIGTETMTIEEYRRRDAGRTRPETGSGTIGSDDEGHGGPHRIVPLQDSTGTRGDSIVDRAYLQSTDRLSGTGFYQRIPDIVHWYDDEATVRVLRVLDGIGVRFDAETNAFLGTFSDGEAFLAGFRVRLRSTNHRYTLEWVQVVNALAAGETPGEIKTLVGGQRGTQAWWGALRRTLLRNFERWRSDWADGLNENGVGQA